jgi:hypothetical protein
MPTTVAMTLDLRGLTVPLSVARTAVAMAGLESGALIEVLTSDPRFGPGPVGLGQGNQQPAGRADPRHRLVPVRPAETVTPCPTSPTSRP